MVAWKVDLWAAWKDFWMVEMMVEMMVVLLAASMGFQSVGQSDQKTAVTMVAQ